jgi:hypothetical protein
LRFLADECCHSAFVVGLREAGYDVRYAAETDRRATDDDLTALAIAEDRMIITAALRFWRAHGQASPTHFRRRVVGPERSRHSRPGRASRIHSIKLG